MNRKQLLAAIALAAAVGLAFFTWASIVEMGVGSVGMVFAVGLVAGVSLKILFESSVAAPTKPGLVRVKPSTKAPSDRNRDRGRSGRRRQRSGRSKPETIK